MSSAGFNVVLRHLRRLAPAEGQSDLTDAELLTLFLDRREEAAFTLLLQRHGPMVLGVCRRILQDRHAMEDAFQATFVVLARRAAVIRKRHSVASWLYGVALRVARRVRAQASVRSRHERLAATMSPRKLVHEPTWEDLREILDEELAALPEKYRAPLVLHYLEGKTQVQVASECRCPRSTLRDRLEQARELLRQRLVRRGVNLSTSALAALLVEQAAPASVPALLTLATMQAVTSGKLSAPAAATAREVVSALAASKLKIVGVLTLTLGIAVAGTMLSAQPQPPAGGESNAPPGHKAEIAQGPSRNRTDALGDPLPPGALVRMGSVRLRPAEGGKSTGFSMAFLPGGNLLATEGHGGIRFWEVATGKETRRIDAPGGATWTFALSPDGKTLAASCLDRAIWLFDATTGKAFRKIPSGGSALLAYSHDGRKLVSVEDEELFIRTVATGKEALRIATKQHACETVAFTADDRAVVTWDYNRGVIYWDAASGKQLRKYEPEDKKLRRFSSPAGGITSLVFSADGKLLATGCLDRAIRIADQETGKEIGKIDLRRDRSKAGESPEARVSAFSPGGKMLLASDKDGSTLWEVTTGKQLWRISGSGPAVFSPDGKTVATGGRFNNSIRLWDVATGQELLHPPGHENSVDRLAFSPDGKLLATRSHGDRTVRLWETPTGRERILRRLPDFGYPLLFASGGKSLAVASWDATVRFLDTETGQETRKIVVSEASAVPRRWEIGVNAIALSPNGRMLVTESTGSGSPGKEQRRCCLQGWDLAGGKQLFKHELTLGYGEVCLAPDGRFFAYAEGQQVVCWDTARNRRRLTLAVPGDGRVAHLVFSPDSKNLAAVTYEVLEKQNRSSWENYTIRLWEIASGQEVLTIPTRDRLIHSLVFSTDGKWIAWGSEEAIHVSDAGSGKELLRRAGHGVQVHSLAFAPDGKTLASGLADTTALIWDVTPAARPSGEITKALQPADLERFWTELAGADGAKAHRAIASLVAAANAVAFLKKHLHPASEQQQRTVREQIADLDDPQYAIRQRAYRQLEQRGAEIEPLLVRALGGKPSPEIRRRLEALLDQPQIIRPGEWLRGLRSIQVLERIGSPEAQAVLKGLAGGAPQALLTEHARATLDRLAIRPARPD
jgi:RNA polymerase sigma factor (sigma-70 family)